MSSLPNTRDRLVAELAKEPPLDDVTKARLEKRFLAAVDAGPSLTSVSVPPPRRRALVASGVVALAAAAALVVWARSGDEAPRYAISSAGGAPAGGAALASAGVVQAGTELSLAAGETAEVELFDLAVSVRERSHLRVEAVSLADVRLSLSSGEARFAFHPRDRGHQHVAISTPAARVEIVGTELTVRATEAGTEVEVHEGVVRVVPLVGEAQLVEAGRAVTIAAPPVSVVAAPAVEGTSADEGASVAALAAGAVETPVEVVPAETAEATSGEATVAEVDAPPVSERLARAEGLDDDAAAERLLLTVVDDPDATREHRAEAWYQIGERRRARAPARALEAFRRAETLGRGDVRALAVFEQAQLCDRELHDAERARVEYARYLAEHPDGPNAASARARLEALGGAP